MRPAAILAPVEASVPMPTVPVVPAPAPADLAPVPAAPIALEPAPDAAPVAAVPVGVTPAVAAPSVPGDGVAVAFTASEPCWAEVVDATGARRLYALLQPGQRVSVQGAPPLRVVLGRGDVTALEISGSAAAIPADAVRNTVARFEIAASGAIRALPPEPRPEPAPAPAPAPAPTPATPGGAS
jgi:cytoskeleton protein RodZ